MFDTASGSLLETASVPGLDKYFNILSVLQGDSLYLRVCRRRQNDGNTGRSYTALTRAMRRVASQSRLPIEQLYDCHSIYLMCAASIVLGKIRLHETAQPSGLASAEEPSSRKKLLCILAVYDTNRIHVKDEQVVPVSHRRQIHASKRRNKGEPHRGPS